MFRAGALLFGLALSSASAVAAADQVPIFDVEPSCQAVKDTEVGRGRTLESCRRDEAQARSVLASQWSQFPKADTRRCTSLASLGGIPSYVELLTCLEMAREVKALRDQNKPTPGTTGAGSNPARKQ
jgi:hypothetical protein